MLHLYLDFSDKSYQKHFTQYLLTHAADRFLLVETCAADAIRLTDASPEDSFDPVNHPVLYFNFTPDITPDREVFSPYQPMEQLLNQIEERILTPSRPHSYQVPISEGLVQESVPSFEDKTIYPGLICVYSPVGGCGKTTFAMALSQALAQANSYEKTLYLSLQSAEDWPLYYHNASGLCFSDLIYALLMNNAPLMEEQRSSMEAIQENGVCFIRPPQYLEDLRNLKEEDLHHLFAFLFKYYKTIICDLDSSFDVLTRFLLHISGKRYYLTNGLPGATIKWQQFLTRLRILSSKEILLEKDSTLLYLCDKDTRDKEMASLFPWKVLSLPWCSKLFRESGNQLNFRQDNDYYERILQLV